MEGERGWGNAGLAATYSSAPWGAVPSALRVFTAEFGMGSGVLPLAMATRPCRPSEAEGQKRVVRVFIEGLPPSVLSVLVILAAGRGRSSQSSD